MMAERPPDAPWQALLVGVASNAHTWDRNFAQSLNSQAELARALERNMPGLGDDDLVVLPEPRYPHEVTDAIGLLNEAHEKAGRAGLARPGLLFYYCGHGLNVDDRLYLATVETIDTDAGRRRTGLALREVFESIADTESFKRRRVVLILDCCFAGLASEEPAAKRAHLLMAVGSDFKAEHDPNSTGPTYFTAALVKLLRDGDPEAGPWIDLDTAYRWLKPQLVALHGPKREPCQHPAGGGGAIVLGRNRAYPRPR
jgi:hypothetical protein